MLFEKFDWLKNLLVLRRLKLINTTHACSFVGIKANGILENSSSALDSFSLQEMTLIIDHSYNYISNIKTLSFKSVNLDSKVDTFFSRCFPQLSKLKLEYYGFRITTLNLVKLDTMTFHYSKKTSKKVTNSISITTLRNNERRFYYLNDHERESISKNLLAAFHSQDCLAFKSFPVDDINNTASSLKLVCNSLGKLVYK